MAISQKAKKRFEAAMTRRAEAKEIIDAIEQGGTGVPQADAVAALGALDPVTEVGDDDAALAADVDARLTQLQAKVDELTAALKDAGLMAE